MSYRMLMNSGILLFVLVTLQCNNATSPNEIFNKGDIIGTWVSSHTVVWTIVKDSLNHYVDTLYDTGSESKTYSITYDTIKISKTFCCIPSPYISPLIGTWSLIGDYLIVYPVSGTNTLTFSTQYLITKSSPDSLIFSSSKGIDTCQKQ